MNSVISLQTVTFEGLIVLQNAAFVDQPLLISWHVAALSQDRLESLDGRVQARLDRELRAIGATYVDDHPFLAAADPGVARIALRSHCSAATPIDQEENPNPRDPRKKTTPPQSDT